MSSDASNRGSGDLPFLPYGRQTIEEDDIDAVVRVLRSDYLTTGPAVEGFERALAERVGARFAVAVSSGTAALHAACFAAGLGPDDEVAVPAITFVATANCARHVGAEPVFVDVDPTTGVVTPATVAARLGDRTRAVIPVHLAGLPVDVEAVARTAREAGAIVIEDAAHAIGASDRGRPVGSCAFSAMTVFSFHPVKQIATGEGGAVVTNDGQLHERLKLFRNHGLVHDPAQFEMPSPGPWYHELQSLGHNVRITDIQCALGASQLRKLDRFLDRRRALAARYERQLGGLPWVEPLVAGADAARSAWHLYVVRIDFRGLGRDRAEVMTQLRERGVGTQVHYIPVPAQPYYRRRGWDPAAFPGALAYYERALSLPLFPTMADTDVDRVVAALRDVLER